MRRYLKIFTLLSLIIIMILVGPQSYAIGGNSPVIALNGPEELFIEIGATYKEYGATASDVEDGDLTSAIVINASTVNTSVKGTYFVTYTVTDADENVTTVQRQIKVGSNLTSEITYDYQYGSYSLNSSYTYYTDVEVDQNGDFVAVGSVSTSSSYSYTYGIVEKVSEKGVSLYRNLSNPYSMYGRYNDVTIRSNNQAYFVGHDTYYTYGIMGMTDYNQTTSASYYSRNARFTEVIDTGNYIISYDSYGGYIYRFSETTYSNRMMSPFSFQAMTTNGNQTFVVVTQNGSDTVVIKYNSSLTSIWTKSISNLSARNIHYSNGLYYIIGNTSNTTNSEIAYTHGGQDGIIVTIDEYGAITNSHTYGGLGNDSFSKVSNANSSKIVLLYSSNSNDGTLDSISNGILIVDKTDLSIHTKTSYTSSLNNPLGIAMNESGKIAIAGQYIGNVSSEAKARILIIDSLFNSGLENKTIGYSSTFDPELGISFYDYGGNPITHFIDSIDGTVNTTIVGNHILYYNITVLTDNGYEKMRIKRTITVDPESSINDGDVFNGSVILDVQGGTLTVNGDPYSYYDTYNIPGESTLTVTGINGYSKSFDFTVNLVHSGIIEGYEYAEPIALTFSGGTATLNGNPYSSGDLITEKGYHTLIITGANGYTKTFSFTMLPTVLNVADGATYITSITPSINAENMTLNGVLYNNEEITNAGHYELIITGVGGYTQTLNFTIETVVSNVVEQGIYDGSVDVVFTKGSATMNGNPIVSGDTVTNPGLNTLVISGEGLYTHEISFTVNLTKQNIVTGGIYQSEITPILSGGTFTLNGASYVSGTLINVPGLYTLHIEGETGYSEDIFFTVHPTSINVTHGSVYQEPRVLATSNGTLKLNGVDYVSGSTLNTAGNYVFEIFGQGGYYRSYEFTMNSGSNLSNGATYISEKTIQFIGSATLNGVAINSGHSITQVGNYNFELVDGVYSESYTFSLIPDLSIYDSPLYLSHVIDIENATLLLDGSSITTGYAINQVGSYVLRIQGINAFSHDVNFDILPEINVLDSTEYVDSVQVIVVGGTQTLNGSSFDGDEVINVVGSYELTITGQNGYSQTINFDVLPSISGLVEGELYIDSVTPDINHSDLLLDGVAYIAGTEINEVGFHTLTINGQNGLAKDIHFMIVSSNLGVEEGAVYSVSTSAVSDVFTMNLNGVPYTSGTTITSLGKNELKLSVGSDEKTITFYVIPLITNVEDGAIYSGSVTPNINYNNLLLNSALYKNNTTIYTVGNHVLKLVNLGSGPTLYTHIIEFTVTEVAVGLTDNGEYTGSVIPNIPYAQSLKLNGNTYSNNSIINQVGYHTLEVTGLNGYTSSYAFTVHPSITNVTDGGVYTSGVNAVIPNSTLLLDGNAFISGSLINAVGYHTLQINGLNGYTSSLSFTILPNIQNVVDDGVYTSDNPKNPVVQYAASLTLNGQPFVSGTTVRNVGYYELIIYGTNGYSQTINFTFNHVISGITENGVYSGSARPFVGYATLFLDDNSFSSGSYIYEVGNHTLKIVGEGGYEHLVDFVINPIITGVAEGVYYTTRTITVNYVQSMTLNGDIFLSGQSVSLLGNYELIIHGVNGYSQSISFIVDYTSISVSDQGVYTTSKQIILPNATLIELNDVAINSGDSITQIGLYTLKIYGNGGYVKIISFEMDYASAQIIDGAEYSSTRTIDIYNASELILNGESVLAGSLIVTVGYYELIIKGVGTFEKTINFTINPGSIGVIEGVVYTNTVVINMENANQLLLNDVPYVSGTPIDMLGNYILTIHGNNLYTKEISFTKVTSILGVADGSDYKQTVIPNIVNASLTLNNEPYVNQTPISYIGTYDLTLSGEGGFTQTVQFTISPTLENVIDQGVYNEFVNFNVVYDYMNSSEAYDVRINDVVYNLNTDYYLTGYHEVIVYGINGYVYEFNITILENSGEINDGATYQTVTEINIPNATLELNGVTITNPYTLKQVGHHTLKVVGTNGYEEIYQFTIIESVSGLISGTVYDLVVKPNIPNATLELDGEPYTNNTNIRTVGHHTLTVIGEGGYTNTYEFTITEKLFGLVDGAISNTPVAFTFSDIDKVEVNGVEKTSPASFNQVGQYVVVVLGSNGYVNQYTFTISLSIDNIVSDGVYTGNVNPIINSSNILLNGMPFASGSQITTIGYHTMIINGEGGYQQTLSFTILPVIQGIENNNVYNSSVTPIIRGAQSLLLNDVLYQSGTTIFQAGHYTLDLIGVNGYEERINFTINDNLVIDYHEKDENSYYGWVDLLTSNAQFSIDDSTITYNELFISEIGSYEVTVFGENNYERSFTFMLEFDLTNQSINDQYQDSFMPDIIGDSTMLLNGEIYEGTLIDVAGNYTLTLIGKDNYQTEYEFAIIPTVEIMNTGYLASFEVSKHTSAIIDGLTISDINNYTTSNVGNHILTVYGLNGYSISQSFTIDPVITLPSRTSDPVQIQVSNTHQSIRLNGNTIGNGYTLTKAGHHSLVIYGTNGYTKVFNFTIDAYIDGFEAQAEYTGSAKYNQSNAIVYVNGNQITSMTTLTQIGYHEVVLKGENGYTSEPFTITIHPSNIGIIQYESYLESVTYSASQATSVSLNGTSTSKSGLINIIGHHTLVLHGTNGYQYEYHFTIDPDISDFDSDVVLFQPLNIANAEELVLNGLTRNENYLISLYGNYILNITGVNNYLLSVSFVVPYRALPEDNQIYDKSVKFDFQGIEVYIDGSIYSSGTTLTTIGHHEMTYRGVGGYEIQLGFTIREEQVLVNNHRYTGELTVLLADGVQYMLDNRYITSGLTRITEVGHHELKVIGSNGYERIYTFTIDPKISIVNGEVLTDTKLLEKIDATMILNGKPITKDTLINEHGDYTLVIKGVGEYEDVTIHFRYENPNVKMTLFVGTPIATTTIIGVLWFILRRKRVF